jgi:hypothetical protein
VKPSSICTVSTTTKVGKWCYCGLKKGKETYSYDFWIDPDDFTGTWGVRELQGGLCHPDFYCYENFCHRFSKDKTSTTTTTTTTTSSVLAEEEIAEGQSISSNPPSHFFYMIFVLFFLFISFAAGHYFGKGKKEFEYESLVGVEMTDSQTRSGYLSYQTQQ